MNSVTTIGRLTNINVTRGDSFYSELTLQRDGQPFTPAEGDLIVFAAETGTGRTVMVKTIPLDTLLLALYPEDTKALRPGTYRYNIRLVAADGQVDTFVQGKLRLEKEVE